MKNLQENEILNIARRAIQLQECSNDAEMYADGSWVSLRMLTQDAVVEAINESGLDVDDDHYHLICNTVDEYERQNDTFLRRNMNKTKNAMVLKLVKKLKV